MEDSLLLSLLFERSETALSEIARKYSSLYKSVLAGLLSDEGEIEECANDVLLAVWNAIPPARPDSLAAYLCAIARRTGIDRVRYRAREKRNAGYTVLLSELSDVVFEDETIANWEKREQEKEISRILSDFLRTLDGESEVFFVRRYFCLASVASLASRFGVSENYISVKLYRARKKLKAVLTKEGIIR